MIIHLPINLMENFNRTHSINLDHLLTVSTQINFMENLNRTYAINFTTYHLSFSTQLPGYKER
jgi:hypothetical protein